MKTEPITAAELITPPTAPAATVTPPNSEKTAADVGPPPNSTPAAPAELDSLDRPFDPSKFKAEKDTLGRWKNKNSGRKPTTPGAAQESGRSFVSADPPLPPGVDKYDAAAEMYSRLGYALTDLTFGGKGEWQPRDDAEHASIKQPLTDYLRETGTIELPKSMILLLAIGSYAAPRFALPSTRARLAFFWDLIRGNRRPVPFPAPEPVAAPAATPILSPQAANEASEQKAAA